MRKPDKIPELLVVANRLKQIRKEKGYKNYEHIAYDLGMSRSAYWRLESGENFSLKTLLKICSHFEMTLAEFCEEIKVPEKSNRKNKSKI